MVSLRNGFLTFAALYAGLTLAYMLYNSVTNPLGSIDLHSYWYAAHFLREGRDPYQAYIAGATPAPPISYGDGITVNDDPAQPSLQTVPVNTAPILLVMAPLAYLSWVPAKTLWLVINTGLMLIAPWLTLRLAQQHGIQLARWHQRAVAIAFFAIAAPRFAVGYGQTSLLAYDLMMGALLLYAKHPIVAGVLFGVALSKYSLVFPVTLLFLYRRQWRLLLTAAVVQIVGVLVINGIGGTLPWTTLQAYVVLAAEHTTKSGIHIGSLYNGSALFRWFAPLVLTLVVGGVGYHLRAFWRDAAEEAGQKASSVGEFSLIVIGLLWGLLVVYHRMYDGLLILPFLIWLVWGVGRLPSPYNRWVQWYGMVIVTILALPIPLYEWLFSSYWSKIFNSVWTLIFCSALAVAFALIRAEIQSGGRSTPNEGTIAGTGALGLRS